jgi:tetratricopeptide (TPR) repeat protein
MHRQKRKAERLFLRTLSFRDNKKSIEYLGKAIDTDPGNRIFYARRSVLLFVEGENQKAAKDYWKAIHYHGIPQEINPLREYLLLSKAYLEFHDGNYSDALSSLSRLINDLLCPSSIANLEKGERQRHLSPSLEMKGLDMIQFKNSLFLTYILISDIHKENFDFSQSLSHLDKAANFASSRKDRETISNKKIEIWRIKAEEERRYKRTLDYKVKNLIRVFIAFWPWLIISPKYIFLSPQGKLVNSIGNLIGIFLFLLGLASGDPESSQALFAVGLLIFLGCVFFSFLGKIANKHEKSILLVFEQLSNKITGMSIYEVVKAGKFL